MPWIEDGPDNWEDMDSYTEDVPIWEQDRISDFDINKRFDANLNPNVSNNQWFRNAYEPRWDTPAARQFLKENAAALEDKELFISSEARKGNIQPYLDHQQYLKDKGLFPKDAETLSNRVSTWFNQKNIDGDLDQSSLNYHDAFSHAYPDKFFGPVDTTDLGLKSVTAAEEARATMLDFLLEDEGSALSEDMGGYVKDWDTVDRPEIYKKLQLHSKRPVHSPDVKAEADYWSNQYMKELDEAAKTSDNPLYKNPYGSPRELYHDPIVGGPYTSDLGVQSRSDSGNPSIYDSFKEGSEARYPKPIGSEFAKKVADENIIPYGRDVAMARNLQLTPQSIASPVKNDIWTNTYFAASPDMAAAKLLSENWRGGVVGAGASLLNPEVAKRAKEGDYLGATHEFGKDVGIGALTEAGIKGLTRAGMYTAPNLTAAVAPFVGGAMNVVGPGIVGAGLFSQGQDDSLTDLAAKATIGQINPYSGTANAQDWDHLGRAQQAREKGGKWKLGGMTIPETGISEYMGLN